MHSFAWTQGFRTLVVAQQNSYTCVVRCCAQRANLGRREIQKRYIHNRNLSPFTAPGTQDDNGDGVPVKEVPLTTNGNGERRNIKVLILEKSTALRGLVSREAPVVHDAYAGALVDVRTNNNYEGLSQSLANEVVEVRLQVDQLIEDSRVSVKKAKNLKPYEEDIEYAEEEKYFSQEKTELVGALQSDALDWKPQKLEISKLGTYYTALAKSRLTGLVVITAVAGYAMAPGPLELTTLACCTLGTGLVSSAANSVNQFFEVPYDSQMDRTKNRVLVRGRLTPLHAVCFATTCSTLGIGMLYFGVNGITAALGTVNLLLYTCAYTPMKRLSIFNTWLGSIVGAIPPMMGWASCTGGLEMGAWLMAGILFAWQFPHFNALSWNLRPDYSRAGYRMMSVTNPALCRRVALRYSAAMVGICTLAPALDVTTWMFAIDSLPLNGYLTYLAWRFYQDADSKSSRKLFMFSLVHLPAIMMLMIISKKHYSKKKEDKEKTHEKNTEGKGSSLNYEINKF